MRVSDMLLEDSNGDGAQDDSQVPGLCDWVVNGTVSQIKEYKNGSYVEKKHSDLKILSSTYLWNFPVESGFKRLFQASDMNNVDICGKGNYEIDKCIQKPCEDRRTKKGLEEKVNILQQTGVGSQWVRGDLSILCEKGKNKKQ